MKSETEVTELRTPLPVSVNGKRVAPYIPSIDLKWATKAARLPGKAFQVGTLIWWRWTLNRKKLVRFSLKFTNEWNVGRGARDRALGFLEAEGLIAIRRRGTGRAPMVEVIFSTEETSE